jgi:hypothetical protein
MMAVVAVCRAPVSLDSLAQGNLQRISCPTPKEALINSMPVIPAQSLPLRKQGPESSNGVNGNTGIPGLPPDQVRGSPGMSDSSELP